MWHKMLEQLPDHEYKIDENKDKNVINPEEFAKEMKNLQEKLNTEDLYFEKEQVHKEMDNLMCELLIELGYEKGINIFKDTPKWYA